MKNKRPNVYNYKEFTIFLKDALGFYQKKENLSLRDLGKKLNTQVSMLSMVLNKKRIPSEALLKKIYNFLDLSEVEVKSVNQLKTIYKSKEIEIQKSSLESLNKKKDFRNAHREEYEFSQYLSKWYYVAIKELTVLSDFVEDAGWIQNKLSFSVTKTEIRKAIKFLKKTEIIVLENGKLISSHKQMNCEDGIFRISLGGFHKQILNLISKAIDVIPREQRLILGYTLSLSEKNKVLADEILKEAFDKIKNLDLQLGLADSNSDKTTKVYHVELASIPLSSSGEKNGKK
ncbi:MAG: TIGR02147 family protein [Pseudobdellovibrio sp.]